MIEKIKRKCEQILDNGDQCDVVAEKGSNYCKKHKQDNLDKLVKERLIQVDFGDKFGDKSVLT